MDWLKEILEKHVDEEGKFNLASAIDEVNVEFPKQAVTKKVFNEKNEDLKSANVLVKELKESNKDADTLQATIDDYEQQVNNLKAERVQEKKDLAINEGLIKVGAKDLDYMKYKLGEVEVDEEGKIIDLESKIKALVEENTGHFDVVADVEETAEGTDVDSTVDSKGGYQVLDNGLEDGAEPDAKSIATSQFEEALGLHE